VWEAAKRAQVNLEDLECFKNVEFLVDIVEGGNVNDVQVTYEVKEKGLLSGGTISVTGGRNEGKGNLEFNLNNLTGRADRIDLKVSQSTASASAFEASYRLPVYGNVQFPATFGMFKESEVSPFETHTQVTRGVFGSYGTYSAFGEHNLRYELGWRELTNLKDTVSFALRQDAGHSMKSALRHTLKIDLTEGQEDSLDTGALTFETEVAGIGGGASFLKNTVDFMYRHPFWGGLWEVGVSCRAGLLHPLIPGFVGRSTRAILDPKAGEAEAAAAEAAADAGPSSKTPLAIRVRPQISDRFFLGGSWDVRGFGLRTIGPVDRQDALGGDGFWAGALHLYTPLPYAPWRERFGNTLRPHFFVNGGACVQKAAGQPWSGAYKTLRDETSASCGIGLAAQLSVIQLELNFCVPVKIHGGAKPQDIQFGVGMHFL
jgi:outer membrane protein insertion porin family